MSIYYHRVVKTGYCLTIDATARELTHCGTPFETIAFTDLNNPKVRDYKVYIFANLYYVTPEKLAVIERLRKAGKTIVWLYAPVLPGQWLRSSPQHQQLPGVALLGGRQRDGDAGLCTS